MHIALVPTSRSGRWAAALLGIFFLYILLSFGVVWLADSAGIRPFRTVLLPILSIVGIGAAVAGFGVALFSVLRRRERSLLIWLVLAAGGMVLFLILGEFLGPPH